MTYSLTLGNSKYGQALPDEDAHAFSHGIFAVADGITRDPAGETDFSKRTPQDMAAAYPNPSGAKMAADVFCKEFIESSLHGTDTRAAFLSANQAIAELNRVHVPKPDYLVNDYFACVAAGAHIIDDTLHWSVIGDCGVIVYGADGTFKLRTPDSFAVFHELELNGTVIFDWKKPEGRTLVRSQYRNNPKQLLDGRCVSYGALTGETTAEPFIYSGEYKLVSGDLVVLYSDGFEETILHPDFPIIARNEKIATESIAAFSTKLAADDYEKYGRERTIIASLFSKS